MNIFRNKVVRYIFSMGTFIVLVSMFFSQLAFNILINSSSIKDKTTLNILSLVSNLAEEDADTSEETKEVNETKEVDLFFTLNRAEHERTFSLLLKEYHDFQDKRSLSGNLQTITQPPEFIS